MTIRRPRPAFTLIELIIVMTLMVIIASLGFLFLPNLNKNKGVPNATTQLEGWIRLSKGQALRDGAPRGVRLILADANDARYDPNSPFTRVTALQYIEQPEPVAPRGAGITLTIQRNISNGFYTATLSGGDPWQVRGVEVGDYLEITASPFVIARITAVSGLSLQLDRAIDGTDTTPLTLTDGFRVIRAPRPLQGEPMLQLHKDVFVDLTYCSPFPTSMALLGAAPSPETNNYSILADWSPAKDPITGLNYLDILFNSSGQVANAPTGQIMLCVRHVERDTGGSGSDRLLVVIYTRTGKVTAVDWNDVPGADPFALARDGKSSGL